MRELPILFSTQMVQSILENRKTMTRRTRGLEVVNKNPDDWKFRQWIAEIEMPISIDSHRFLHAEFENEKLGICGLAKASYNLGDRIWVRETFFDTRKWKHAPLFAESPDFIYKADEDAFIGEHKWKPSLFMPKEAARIWLEVTKVRCELLQEISNEDCVSEGIPASDLQGEEYRQFVNLWESINGKDSWLNNPFVFVYEFKRIEHAQAQ